MQSICEDLGYVAILRPICGKKSQAQVIQAERQYWAILSHIATMREYKSAQNHVLLWHARVQMCSALKSSSAETEPCAQEAIANLQRDLDNEFGPVGGQFTNPEYVFSLATLSLERIDAQARSDLEACRSHAIGRFDDGMKPVAEVAEDVVRSCADLAFEYVNLNTSKDTSAIYIDPSRVALNSQMIHLLVNDSFGTLVTQEAVIAKRHNKLAGSKEADNSVASPN